MKMLLTVVLSVSMLLTSTVTIVASQAYYHDEPIHHPQPYNFGYKIHDGYGNHNYQEETGDSYGAKKGSYGFTGADGIYRKVDYIADADGFRAKISTNEPGTAPSSSADVHVDQYHGPPQAPHVVGHHSPVVAAPAYHEPVYAYRPVTVYAPPPAPYVPYYHPHPVDHYPDHHHHHRASKK